MAGEYRKEEVLSQINASWVDMIKDGTLRIALTSQPIIGATVVKELVEPMAAAYEKVMSKYTTGLRNGTMVPITLNKEKVYRNNGELFFST